MKAMCASSPSVTATGRTDLSTSSKCERTSIVGIVSMEEVACASTVRACDFGGKSSHRNRAHLRIALCSLPTFLLPRTNTVKNNDGPNSGEILCDLTSAKMQFDGIWYHIAGVMSGHTIKIYLNGGLSDLGGGVVTCDLGPISVEPRQVTRGYHKIGASQYPLDSSDDDDGNWQGEIAYSRYWNSALTDEQVAILYAQRNQW